MRGLLDHHVTVALIAINVLVSLVGFSALKSDKHRSKFLFIAYEAAKGKNWLGTFLSHFAHGDFGHLALNMIALYFFGPEVEAALGPIPYVATYLAAGAAGTFTIFLFRRKDRRHAALGASGSIAGVVFASVVIAPTASIYLLLIPIPIPAPVFAVLYLLMSSFFIGRGDGIAHEAHLGGAVAGFALAGVLSPSGFEPLVAAVERLLG